MVAIACRLNQKTGLSAGLAQRLYARPWLAVPPIGLGELSKQDSKLEIPAVADAAK
jgi:hypothetical protein